MKTAIPQAVGWYAVWYPRPDGLLLRDVAFCFPVEKGSAMTLSREPDQVVRALRGARSSRDRSRLRRKRARAPTLRRAERNLRDDEPSVPRDEEPLVATKPERQSSAREGVTLRA
jgi:hypothetical protein